MHKKAAAAADVSLCFGLLLSLLFLAVQLFNQKKTRRVKLNANPNLFCKFSLNRKKLGR